MHLLEPPQYHFQLKLASSGSPEGSGALQALWLKLWPGLCLCSRRSSVEERHSASESLRTSSASTLRSPASLRRSLRRASQSQATVYCQLQNQQHPY